MDKTLYIVIGCDTDPDRPGFIENLPVDGLSWRGMLEGIPRAKEKVKSIKDSIGNSPVFSWCLRADYQIKKIHGSYNYILANHKEFLLELEEDGDELAWHPHFWKDDENGKWYQEVFDLDWQVNMLKEAFAAYQNVLPDRAKSVRMGWDFHNNETFGTLQNLGIKVDFSGIPRLKITPKNKNIRSVNFFDWSLSPNHPYFPALADYRRNAKDNESIFDLLESPNFISKSIIWGTISGLVLAKKMKDIKPLFNALRRPSYWINITGKSTLFAPLMDQVKRDFKYRDKIFFITYFHPDELLKNKSSLYSLKNMANNISSLVERVEHYGAHAKFIQAREILNYI